MAKTTISIETAFEDCGLTCPHFKVSEGIMVVDGFKYFGKYECEYHKICEEALCQAGVLKEEE